MTSAFSWQNSVSLCPASFHIPRPNLSVTPGVSGLLTFAFQSTIMKRTSFLGVNSRRSCRGLRRTIQILQHYWLGHRLGLLWYWMFVFPFFFCIVTLKCVCLYIIYCNNCIILITFFNFDNSSYVGFLSWWITLSGLFLTRVKGSKDKCLGQFLQHICQWVWITFSVDFPHESSL